MARRGKRAPANPLRLANYDASSEFVLFILIFQRTKRAHCLPPATRLQHLNVPTATCQSLVPPLPAARLPPLTPPLTHSTAGHQKAEALSALARAAKAKQATTPVVPAGENVPVPPQGEPQASSLLFIAINYYTAATL